MLPFEESSYLAQVHRLRELAKAVLAQYPIKVHNIELKRHAANTVFKVTDHKGKAFQLRIHPKDFHTKEAIAEEIKWLNYLNKLKHIKVPEPVLSKLGSYIIEGQHSLIPGTRYCELFTWLPGRKRWHSINEQYAYDLGCIMGQLRESGKHVKIKFRKNLDIDSMIGTHKAQYHNVERLSGLTMKEQSLIREARNEVYTRLTTYKKNHPEMIGLIHGDLQPNNILYHNNKLSLIDFDNCGIGLYPFELATSLRAFQQVAKGRRKKSYQALEDALFQGYLKHGSLSKNDIAIIPECMLAVVLITIAWLERHKDNKNLKKYYSTAVNEAIQYYQSLNR